MVGQNGRTSWAPSLGVGALLLVGYLGRHPLAQAWHGLGAWHWVVLLLVVLLGGAGVVSLLASLPVSAPGGAALQRRAREVEAAVEAERRSVGGLTETQFVLLVSRTLRRDGWVDAHVETSDPSGTLVVARSGATSLLVRCKHAGSGRAGLGEVADLAGLAASVPGAVPVVMSTGGATHSAEATAQRRGVVVVDGAGVARWLALGASTWPVPATS